MTSWWKTCGPWRICVWPSRTNRGARNDGVYFMGSPTNRWMIWVYPPF
jgi:hypothetical protein